MSKKSAKAIKEKGPAVARKLREAAQIIETAPEAASDCPIHGPFEGEACAGCVGQYVFSERELARTMLLEAALMRAVPHLQAAAMNADAATAPKARDDLAAAMCALNFGS